MRLSSLLFGVSLCWALGHTSANAEASDMPSCKMIDDTTLSVKGDIQQPLFDCIMSLNLTNLETIIVDSNGGNMKMAMTIGDKIAPYRPHIIIDQDCNSSCAIYWVPLAHKITFADDARIVVHGSGDSGMFNKVIEEEKPDQSEQQRLKALVELQARYIERHNIPRGWMQYRTDYSKGLEAYKPWLQGKPDIPFLSGNIVLKALIVDRPMLETCLPDIVIEDFEQSYMASKSWKFRRKLAKNGRLSTGTMACPAETVSRQ